MREETPRCGLCYQEKYKLGDKWICLGMEFSPLTHGFSEHGPYERGGRGMSLVETLDKYYGISLEEYRILREVK